MNIKKEIDSHQSQVTTPLSNRRGVGGEAVLLLLLLFSLPSFAQTKQINNLKNQKAKLEKDYRDSQNRLNQNQKQTAKTEQTADFLENQLEVRLDYIHQLEQQMDTLQQDVERLEGEVQELDSQVTMRKQKYIQCLRAARQSQVTRNPVMFIFSAETYPKMIRRMRYAREQASLQKELGIRYMDKQNKARNKQDQLLTAKHKLSSVVQEVIRQRHMLATRHSVVKANAAQLQRKQKEIKQQMQEQQQKLAELNRKIDELVAYEMEQARKKAAAEARRKHDAEAAQKRALAQKDKKGAKSNSQKTSGKSTNSKSSNSASGWLTAEDRQLNGNLEQNKGRLPVPITGAYQVVRSFGLHQVSKGVMLDNKGINYMGQAGARARAIFDGEVSAVFQLGDQKNVLIRHGSYISVYCNLSSTIVTRGQKVRACDLIGSVAQDEQGDYVLHFQLRKETSKLNPANWIGRGKR